MAAVAVAVALVFTVVACSGGTAVVPWINQKPAKYHPPKLAPACTAKDMKAAPLMLGLAGGAAGTIELTNIGDHPCSLVGRPRLAFRHVRLSVTPEPLPSWVSSDSLQNPLGSLRALQPGKAAWDFITWLFWCGPGGDPGVLPDGLAVMLPGGGRIVLPIRRGSASCYGPSGSASLSATPFYPAPRSPSPSSRLPLSATIVGMKTDIRIVPKAEGAAVKAYTRIHRGEIVRYRIALKNTSKRPLRFRSCPAYSEGLGLTKLTYILNCRSVGMIAPEKTVLFAMEFRVPQHAQLGPGGLFWELLPDTSSSPSAFAVVWVVP